MKRIIRNIIPLLVLCFCLSLATSCRTSKKVADDFKVTVAKPSDLRKRIVDEAYTWLGTPYAYSKAEKGIATDCSGMVLQVYEKIVGVKLPRNSAQQADFCKNINKNEVHIGDLVFFATGKDEGKISHVGIVVDDKKFIHASASKGVVISDMSHPYYIKTFRRFGRVDKLN